MAMHRATDIWHRGWAVQKCYHQKQVSGTEMTVLQIVYSGICGQRSGLLPGTISAVCPQGRI